MNELIHVTDNNGKKAVSARELYEKLGFNSAHWAKWYEKNITRNPFAIENQDWQVFTLSVKTSEGGRPTQDFTLSIDFAKRLSMLARTEAGEKIRNYFIEVEKAALVQIPKSKSEILLQALNILNEEIEHERAERERLLITNELQTEQLKISAPKVKYANEVLASDTLIATTIIAKELGMSAVTLNKMLHELNIIHNVNGTWVLYSKYQSMGYAGTKTYSYTGNDGMSKTAIKLYWTEKGREFIHRIVKN